MKSILRLIVWVALFGGIMTLGEQLVLEPMVGAAFVGLAYWLFGDFFGFLQNVDFLDKIRRFLFWVCMLIALFVGFAGSYQELFYEGSFFGMDALSKALVCGSLPATVATLWLASLADYHDTNKAVVPLLMVGGLILGGIVGFVVSFFTALGPVVILAICVIISVVALALLFKFYKRNGWIMASIGASLPDDDYNNYKPSRKSGGRSYSSGGATSYGTSSYSGGTSEAEYEGNHQLDYYMDDIASDNSRSRNLPYGCSIRSDVSFSHYGDDAYFTVDFTLDTSCCSAETQHEYDMMISDAQSFQREVMNDLFREGKNLIGRLKQKYKGWPGVNFEVKLGDISEY